MTATFTAVFPIEHPLPIERLTREDCRGELLNHTGKSAGIDPYSLFIGPEAHALRYASPELRDWWTRNPRVTVAEFERAWHDDRYYGGGVTA